MEKPWLAENEAVKARLVALVARLSDEELSRPMSDGWTVAAVLAHMAFWDGRALHFIGKFEDGATPSAADQEIEDVDWINTGMKPLCLALPPHTAANLALQTAQETSQRVAALSDELLEKIFAVGNIFNIHLAEHWGHHLDEIEDVLQELESLS